MRSTEELLKILFQLRKEASSKSNIGEKIANEKTAAQNLSVIRHLTTP